MSSAYRSRGASTSPGFAVARDRRATSGLGKWFGHVCMFLAPIFVFLLAWELAVRGGVISGSILPAPTVIVERMGFLLFTSGPEKGGLVRSVVASFYRAIAAFSISVVVAIPLGFLLGLRTTAYAWASPVLSLLLPLPAVAWTPVLLVAFGQGDKTIIIVCFLGAFFPILYTTMQGVRDVGQQSVWVMRSMGGGYRDIFFHVLIPATLPALIAGLKLGMAHSWRTLVAAEMLAAMGAGLGYMIFAARTYMDVKTMFVGIVLLAAIGMFIERCVFGTLERITVSRWRGRDSRSSE